MLTSLAINESVKALLTRNQSSIKRLVLSIHSIFKFLLTVSIALSTALSNANEPAINAKPLKEGAISLSTSELNELRTTIEKQDIEINELRITIKKQDGEINSLINDHLINHKKNELALIEQSKSQSKQETKLELIEKLLNTIESEKSYFSYADWAAIAITCVAVLLTIVGLAIAGLAFWGFREIKELTKNSAAAEAKIVAQKTMEEMIHDVAKSQLEKLINDGKLREPLQDAVDMIMRNDKNSDDKKRAEELLDELDSIESDFDGSESNESIDNKSK